MSDVDQACAASVEAKDGLCRFILRGGRDVADKASVALGVTVPADPCTASVMADIAALWLGPDEWLVLAPRAESGRIARALNDALADGPHSLVEISDRNQAVTVRGPKAEDVLNSGCPLDLGERAYPIGMCTRTVFHKAEIVLWRRAADQFHVEMIRSFRPYVLGLLDLAIRDNDAV